MYKEPLTIKRPTRKVSLFFEDKPTYVAPYEIINIQSYIASIRMKKPTFIGYNINDGEIVYEKWYLDKINIKPPSSKSLF
jgi:hypothetical protein